MGNRLAARTRGWWPEVATKARRGREEDGESGATAGLSLAARENERQGDQWGSGPVVQGRVGEGGGGRRRDVWHDCEGGTQPAIETRPRQAWAARSGARRD
jgi:hypothetical protein